MIFYLGPNSNLHSAHFYDTHATPGPTPAHVEANDPQQLLRYQSLSQPQNRRTLRGLLCEIMERSEIRKAAHENTVGWSALCVPGMGIMDAG